MLLLTALSCLEARAGNLIIVTPASYPISVMVCTVARTLLIRSELPQPVAQVMRLLDDGPLALLLDLLGAHDQEPDGARLDLALGPHDHRLALLQLPGPPLVVVEPLPLGAGRRARGQAAPRARQAGGHEGGARQDEADGAAVDAYAGEGGGEAVDEAQVRQQGGCRVVLEEERLRVQHVQRAPVRQLHRLQRHLLRQDLVDVRVQQRVRRQKRRP